MASKVIRALNAKEGGGPTSNLASATRAWPTGGATTGLDKKEDRTKSGRVNKQKRKLSGGRCRKGAGSPKKTAKISWQGHARHFEQWCPEGGAGQV